MIYSIINLGLIYSLLALGVYITYSILDFPDLGVDGVICLGGAITSKLIINNINPYLATLIAILFGSIAGLITGLINIKFKINKLLCGIITTTGLYSINLIILNGRPNLSLSSNKNIFSWLIDLKLFSSELAFLVINLIICFVIKVLLNFIMNSCFGLYLRCIGSNERLVSCFGGNINKFKLIGLMLSNSLVAFCGALIVQQQGYYDIGMSMGALVLGLTMVILGLTLNKYLKKLDTSICVILGAFIYEIIIFMALNIGLPAIWLKFSTAVLLIIILIFKRGDK